MKPTKLTPITVGRNHPGVTPAMRRLIALVESAGSPTPTELADSMRRVGLTLNDVADFIKPSDETYYREEVYRSGNAAILVLTWMPGQRSPIHGHAGSVCAFQVMAGVATETTFTPTAPTVASATGINRYNSGDIAAMDGARIHAVANAERTPLVTLHVYTPPLSPAAPYTLGSSKAITDSAPDAQPDAQSSSGHPSDATEPGCANPCGRRGSGCNRCGRAR